jgi:ClpP class serine protease
MGHGKGRERKKKRQAILQQQRAAAAARPRQYKDRMGIFSEYITNKTVLANPDLERRAQLKRIGVLRGTAVISYAGRLTPGPQGVDPSINFDDVLPFRDQMGGLKGDRVSVVLETLGGIGEVGRKIVEMLHDRFAYFEFIIPDTAKSTGTIMCLGGHEILMGPGSSLGPIDAQLVQDGKRFSADALIEGFEAIKRGVVTAGGLNPAYIPMLQRISPGELQNAHNTLEFARATVAEWLATYKFSTWEKDGAPVPDERKKERARYIADELAKQSKWFTHGRALRIPELTALGLQIMDFSKEAELNDAISRYAVLLRLTMEAGTVYKIFETPDATIAKRSQAPVVSPTQIGNMLQQMPSIQMEGECNTCHEKLSVQLDFVQGQPLQPGSVRYPNDGTLPCPRCKSPLQLAQARAEIEKQLNRKALTPQPTA